MTDGDDPNKCSECGGFCMGENMMHNDWCSQCTTTTTSEKLPETKEELKFRFKRDKRLTKKQLYGYSYMKWDIVREEFRKIRFGYCSFCFAALKKQKRDKTSDGDMCYYCQIDKTLCNSHGKDSLYSAVNRASREFRHLVNEMCRELQMRYYNHD